MTTKRFWSAVLAFLIGLGMMTIVPATSASADYTPPSKYYAKDDKVTQKFYFFADPFTSKGGKLVKNEYYKSYFKRPCYTIEVGGNDKLGRTLGDGYINDPKDQSRGQWGDYLFPSIPRRGILGCPDEWNYWMSAWDRYVVYSPSKAGTDSLSYTVEDKTGLTHTAAVTGIRNIAVRNVSATSLNGAVRLTNPNAFTVLVTVRPTFNEMFDYREEFKLRAGQSLVFKLDKVQRRSWKRADVYKAGRIYYTTTVAARVNNTDGTVPSVYFSASVMKYASAPKAKVSAGKTTARLRLVGAKKGVSTFKVSYKKKGWKTYRTSIKRVRAKSSKLVTLKHLKPGSKVIVKAKVKGAYKTLIKKRVK